MCERQAECVNVIVGGKMRRERETTKSTLLYSDSNNNDHQNVNKTQMSLVNLLWLRYCHCFTTSLILWLYRFVYIICICDKLSIKHFWIRFLHSAALSQKLFSFPFQIALNWNCICDVLISIYRNQCTNCPILKKTKNEFAIANKYANMSGPLTEVEKDEQNKII